MLSNNSRTLLSCTCSVLSCNSCSIPFYPNHVHKYPTLPPLTMTYDLNGHLNSFITKVTKC